MEEATIDLLSKERLNDLNAHQAFTGGYHELVNFLRDVLDLTDISIDELQYIEENEGAEGILNRWKDFFYGNSQLAFNLYTLFDMIAQNPESIDEAREYLSNNIELSRASNKPLKKILARIAGFFM
ncbi:hypothetical protein GF362_02605 [Candidatus Dojkabacteria bacterium]|nr:hypothetical protein [Candidatus Dojkabacteria bacterium]